MNLSLTSLGQYLWLPDPSLHIVHTPNSNLTGKPTYYKRVSGDSDISTSGIGSADGTAEFGPGACVRADREGISCFHKAL